MAVADLDARTARFPTPIAGVLGADVLAGRVLDVSFSPCRVSLYERGHAPRFARNALQLPLRLEDGRARTPAIATDGDRLLTGDFVVSTGFGDHMRLDAGWIEGGKAGTVRRLRAVSFAGGLREEVKATLAQDEADAALGAPMLAPYRVRFDFAHGRLLLAASAQQKGPPERSSGP